MLKLANAPCSWGVIENTAGERAGYVQVLDEIYETGYKGTELGDWGFMPTNPSVLRAELAARQLELVASWVSIRLYDAAYHDRGIEAAVRTARLMAEAAGDHCIIVIGDDHSTVAERFANSGRIQPEHGLDEAGWQVYTDGAQRVAQAVKDETGLRSVIHPHGATYVETPAEIDEFLRRTDPNLVGLVFDTGHYALGGGNAVEGIERFYDRTWLVHFKDFNPVVLKEGIERGWNYRDLVGNGVFSELGQGSIDFPSVLGFLHRVGYTGWVVVEQDVLPGMGTPKESAARNRDYLGNLGLV